MNRIFHILFWVFVSLGLLVLFGSISGNYTYAFYFLAFFVPVVIMTSWVFTGVLIPNYLLKKRYRKFMLYSLYTLIISLDLEMLLVFLAFLVISYYDFANLGAIIDIYKWMPIVMYLVVFLAGFTNVVVLLIRQQEQGDEPAAAITVRSERKNRRILLSQIMYIESMSDYIRIILENGEKVVTRERISTIHGQLPDSFIRIHRSFVVNKKKVAAFNREQFVVGEVEIPVSRTYRKEAMDLVSDIEPRTI